MSLPPITTVKFSYTGTNNVPSYFDIEFLDAQFRGLIGSSSYDAWCADRDTPINPPAGTPTGGSFQITLQAKVYSIYELGVNSAVFPVLKIENPQNLDVVNWLFNQNFSAPGNGYTFGEVQAAAWELLGDPYAGSTSIGTVDPAKVTALINLALANGNNYQSDITDSDSTNDYTLLLLAPYRTDGVAQQPTLVQVKSAALGNFVWHDTNANGIQDTSEVGIAGAVVKLVRDLNDDGDFDDLNEVLAQTTTGAQGEYKFTGLTPGLDYQVLFMTPSGYDATSPRQSDSLPLSGVNSDGLVSDKVILSAGEYNQTIDAGFYKLAELGDQVWLDGNGNGQQDNQEAGVADVTVKLLDSTGTVIRTTVTDGNGFYLFDNLNPGTYSVEFVAPTGFLFTNNDIGSDTTDSDANTTNGKTGSYSLLSGDSDLTVDAGLIAEIIPAQLGDRVWEDKNANGQQDAGENGIANATVRLYTCVNNTKGVLVGTTTTDGAGNYNFANLIPGDYIVEFVTPDGYTSTVANVGGDASDSDNVGGLSGCYTLQPGQNETTVDAGFYKTASLGDYVWVDSNADGVQNDGQTGLNGVTVNLLDGSGAVIATQVTANDTNGNPGYYLFSDLVPGTYAVEFVKPAGYEFTSQDQGANDGADSDANATTGRTITTTLESGENDLTWDAGVVLQKASIGDRVWEDKNANGQQDAGENGIANATVRLYTCVNNTKGVLVGTTTTDGAGNYNFSNLIPGDYIVEFVTPDGYTSTVANVGGDASDSDNVGGLSGCYTLQPGQNETTVDAGFYKTASLGDYVWVDSNADGVQNDGQTGLNGVTVNLLDGSGAVIATQVTANDTNGNPGYYLFSDLVPGTYAVEFVKPAGYEFTSQDQGANDGADSDANATTGRTITTTLESGENDLTWDAGVVLQKASIGDRVWEDKNANGQQDAGENGIANATVRLYTCVNNTKGVLVGTTTTDGAGNYNFANLIPGDYIVEFVTPDGYTSTVANVGGDASDSDNVSGLSGCYTLQPGQNETTVDAGFYKTASLGDYVWVDSNADGIQNDGQTGLNGVTVNLLDGSGAVIATQVTANDTNGNPGYYLFSDLVPGTYAVEFVKPAGYEFTSQDQGANDGADSDANATTGRTITTTLESGENDLTWDAGVVLQKASIGDRVWEDKNANGQQDAGENGIANATVRLYTCVNNTKGVLVGTTTTDGAGNYNFANLIPGDYIVEFVTPDGYTSTVANVGGDASDSDNVSGLSGCYTLQPGQNETTVDAGFYKTASLGDYVWVDSNADGIQNDGQTGLNGVTVNLLDGSGAVIATQVTANDTNGNPGYYLFSDLVPGTYAVEFVKPAGYEFTSQDQGANDGADSDANATTGRTITTTLESGENDLTWDAGVVLQKASIGDRVWEDKNANGQQDAGENGIANATVRLYTCVNNTKGVLVGTTTTDGAGNYNFSNLIPGDYIVEFVTPDGYTSTVANVGGDASDSDNVSGLSGCYTLQPGQNETTVDAGFYKTASLGDYVWVDSNADGIQNDGQTGLNGVTVNLLDGSGAVIATQVTANDTNGNPGYYLFSDLVPGTYAVEFVKPAGYEFTSQDQGANDGADSDANATTGRTITTTLESGENDLTWDAGVVLQKASIGDRVWEDKNANGQQDAGENGIANATVRLYTCVNNTKGVLVGTTTTDGAGNYNFANLIPGDYIVEFVTPDGYTSTVANVGGDASDSDNVSGLSGCYTLQPGQNETTVDAGFYKTASLGDYVWVDSNADGIQNDGQTGLNGVTVNLLDGSGAVIATQVTANDTNGNPGYYLFSDLVPGTYAVEFVKPAGYEFTSQDQGANDGADSDANATTGRTITTTLESGENDLTWDAGVVLQKASIGDRVWEDKNANGQQDAGENGIANATVRLYTCVNNTKGVLVGTTTTDGAGNYNFANLIPGDYIVEFVTPDGYTSTVANVGGDASDSDNVSGLSGCYTLQPGQNETTVDAGFYKTASLGDYVWVDSNADGIQNDGQTGLNGVTVNLLDGSGAVIATQVTANDTNGNPGYYLFSDLVPGTYAVEFVKPAGYEFTSQDQGANDGADSDANATTGRTITTTLESGENDLTWDAGLKAKASVCLTYNFDGNSSTDGTDGNSRSYTVDGVTVNASAWSRDKTYGTWSKAFLGAYSGGHGVTDSSEGSGSGNTHTVDNVGRDNYVVYQFSQNVTVDKAFLGYVSGDSDIQVWIGSTSTPITSMSNTVLSNLGFTEINSTTSTTTRWADVNANNLSGNVLVIAADTTDTSPEDFFKIQQLVVCTDETQQGGKASIGNRVWCDTDGNGIQNNGELGVAGVTVKLLNSSGTVVASTTTNTDGIYNFTNLNPGDYKVQVVKPAGYSGFTLANQGGDDTIDSDVNSTGVSALTTLVAGENDTSWDAGFAPNKLTITYDFNGNTYTDGTDGNSRSYTVNGVTVNASAWSRDKTYGTWSKAFLGAYSGGHGVTDSSEGSGSGNTHTVDNVGRNNYVVYQFSQNVTVDKAFLGYVSGDSDIQVWIGSTSTPITSMSNTVLSNLGFTEINSTTLTTTRWADINANNLSGNVLVIAADTTDTTPEDYFKIQNLTVSTNDPFLTPIALDLDGDGVETAALSSSSGSFDLMGNGQAIQSGWLSGDDGFLAADLNNNGRIDDISELFGGTAKGAGFEQLAKFDSNADRVIDSSDAQFNQLIVWQDSNENHQTDANELLSLVDVGIISFDLNYSDSAHMDAQGNIHMENSHATLTNGSSIQMTDVYFNVSAADAATAGVDLYNAVTDPSTTDASLIGVNTGSVL